MNAMSAVEPALSVRTGQRTALAVAAGLFAIWGLALWLYNALFFRFTEFFNLTPVHMAWTMALFHVAYFLLAIPAVLFQRQFGYKLGFLFGLSIFALGAFLLYLAIIEHSGLYFLGAVVMIGSCGAWLDTSLNPLAIEAGDPRTAVARLGFAQAFNGFGLFTGTWTATWIIEAHYTLSVGATAHLSARPYVLVGLGAILLAFLVEQISLPPFASARADKNDKVRVELRPLLGDRTFLLAAAALFSYTMVLTILWTSNYNYRVSEAPGHGTELFERIFFWFALGRCVGAGLMRVIDPLRLLQASIALTLAVVAYAVIAGGVAGYHCLLSASFFLSIAFPNVFGSALVRHRPRMKLAAGLLAAGAGAGNALSCLLVPLALHALNIGPRTVILFALPFAAVILAYSFVAYSGRKNAAAA